MSQCININDLITQEKLTGKKIDWSCSTNLLEEPDIHGKKFFSEEKLTKVNRKIWKVVNVTELDHLVLVFQKYKITIKIY